MTTKVTKDIVNSSIRNYNKHRPVIYMVQANSDKPFVVWSSPTDIYAITRLYPHISAKAWLDNIQAEVLRDFGPRSKLEQISETQFKILMDD